MDTLTSFVQITTTDMQKLIDDYITRAEALHSKQFEAKRIELTAKMKKGWFSEWKTTDPTINDIRIWERARDDGWGFNCQLDRADARLQNRRDYMVPFQNAIELSSDGLVQLGLEDIERYGFKLNDGV